MTKLRDAIGQIDDLVFISDRHKSLLKAINTVFPNAQHGVCCHHLKMNMKDKFKRCKDIDSMYWGAAKAYRISDFEERMSMIQSVSQGAYNYLNEVGYPKWARAHFNGRRYNIMTTNIAESMNAVVRYAHSLPITNLVEYLRMTIQS